MNRNGNESKDTDKYRRNRQTNNSKDGRMKHCEQVQHKKIRKMNSFSIVHKCDFLLCIIIVFITCL